MLLVLILLAACTSLSPHPTTDPTPTSTSVPTPALSLAGAHVFSLTQYAISDQSITNVRRVGIYEAWLGNRLLGTLAPVAQDILTLMVDGPSGERFLVGVVTRTSAMRLEIEASPPPPADNNFRIDSSGWLFPRAVVLSRQQTAH